MMLTFAEKTCDPSCSPEPIRVLVVEDQEVIQDLLLTVFQAAGFQTFVAGSVAEAMEKLAERPQFCTLDLHLPDGRGTEVLQRIRDHGLPIKVAVTTGTIDIPLLQAARQLQPDRVFQKPYRATDLVAWIRADH